MSVSAEAQADPGSLSPGPLGYSRRFLTRDALSAHPLAIPAVLYRVVQEVVFAVTGSLQENEVLLLSVLKCLTDATT